MRIYLIVLLATCILLVACNGQSDNPKHIGKIAHELVPVDTLSFKTDSLSLNEALWLVKSVYDTVTNTPQTDNKADTVTREDATLKYFEDQSGKYYLYIVENRGPDYGSSIGWCDVFVMQRFDGEWKLNDFMLHANSGGMYGNPGSFEKLVKTGDEDMGIVIAGGQTHMGNNFNVTIVALNRGKLGKSFYLPTRRDYGEGADYKLTVCDENKYHFKKAADRKNYDLVIERFNCLGDSAVKTDSVSIPYNDGYSIPDRFLFEG